MNKKANLINDGFQTTHGDLMDPQMLRKYVLLLTDKQRREMCGAGEGQPKLRELLRTPVLLPL